MDGVGIVESEKITINVGAVDLGKIDLLVDEGFYAGRTDFIRTAIRSQLERHEGEMNQTITRKQMAVGLLHYGRRDLEERIGGGDRLAVSVVGLLSLAPDVTPDLARDAFESITVRGMFRAGKDVKEALADRMH
jgi:Arc/MetJ-type ribon-helix-helix transcriptional regulator